jgi:hypothetical protein
MTSRDRALIVKPEVEEVADDKQVGAGLHRPLQDLKKTVFAFDVLLAGSIPKVHVRNKQHLRTRWEANRDRCT